jgi:hypothetical protein
MGRKVRRDILHLVAFKPDRYIDGPYYHSGRKIVQYKGNLFLCAGNVIFTFNDLIS